MEIIKNYTDSEKAITKLVEEFLEKSRKRRGDAVSYSRMLHCPPEIMDSALSSIVEEYRDIENYLKSLGLTRDNLIKLKDRLLKRQKVLKDQKFNLFLCNTHYPFLTQKSSFLTPFEFPFSRCKPSMLYLKGKTI